MTTDRPDSLPEYLRQRMDELGISSIRALAARTGVAPETARRLLTRSKTPDEQTLRKIAEGLPAPIQRLRELAGRPPGAATPFVLPPVADQLNERERDVILQMVFALLDASGRLDLASDRADANARD
ncbi:helix-turn-helix transcriptional regulator [Pseudonocardia zijingensis]|uniref:HTH cro/C1-type domain-containing protein n=1 Tax=Pseudonocardia zijingensis TaxID=153376 RepID=A0ABN1N8V7_9PSEU